MSSQHVSPFYIKVMKILFFYF